MAYLFLKVTKVLLLIITFTLVFEHLVVELVRVVISVEAVVGLFLVVLFHLFDQRVLYLGVLAIALNHLLAGSKLLQQLSLGGWLLHQFVIQLPLLLQLLELQLLKLIVDSHILLVVLYLSLVFQSLSLAFQSVLTILEFLVLCDHASMLNFLVSQLSLTIGLQSVASPAHRA